MKGTKIRALRQRLGLTQKEFADQFGFTLATLQQWEQGRRNPQHAVAVLLEVIQIAPNVVAQALESVRL